MRIEFRRAGGFAAPAMRQSYTVDSDDISAEEAQELQRLVEQSNVVNLSKIKGHSVTQHPRPDTFFYSLIIEDSEGKHVVETSDLDMPASLRPLVSWLSKRASRPA